MNEYRIKAYAKINLGLDVVRRLENGYHEVKMVMQTVGIYDVLDFQRTAGGIVITTDSGELPTNEDNLIYKAAKLMIEKYHIIEGVKIHLEKHIPIAAGMAGGSTDAAAYSYSSTSAAKEKTSAEEVKSTKTAEDTGVIYEHSTDTKTSSTKKTYKPDTALINKLKADADARTSQLRSLVEQIMGKQADTYGNANDIWSFLRSGNYTVDPATKAQAQADIAEDGYWGVNQTSDRIIQFATALTGGDPDKIESMREAFKKGYAQAEKTWGGSLPEISQKTYDAVMEKFDKLAADAGLTTEA
jgi:hypothetical protein